MPRGGSAALRPRPSPQRHLAPLVPPGGASPPERAGSGRRLWQLPASPSPRRAPTPGGKGSCKGWAPTGKGRPAEGEPRRHRPAGPRFPPPVRPLPVGALWRAQLVVEEAVSGEVINEFCSQDSDFRIYLFKF